MRLDRLTILGVGLLGGSIGLACRAAASDVEIIGYAHRPQTLDLAREAGAIDWGYADPGAAVQGADLVILCTPVSLFQNMLRQIAPALKAGAIITDVGSTKRSIVRLAGEILPPGVHFVGSHPMAGSEKRGVEFARADLFQHAQCLVTPTAQTPAPALESVEAFWRMLGMRIARMTPEDHDRLLGAISHLPHAAAAALVAMQDDAALELAGKGFLDTTRIAGGDGALWRDILLDNRDNLRAALSALRAQLDTLDQLLEDPAGAALAQWLDRAALRREALLRKKLLEISTD
jgi:prephenate dehydrogenase